MKIIINLLFVCLWSGLFAQKPEPLKATVELFRQQMIDPERAILEKILHEDLSYGHSSGFLE